MVLTDRQRAELHAGIYAYLQTRGEAFAQVAEALATADPSVLPSPESQKSEVRRSSTGGVPILEKKWTAVPRLQKKVLELERALAQAARSGGMGPSLGVGIGGSPAVGPAGVAALANRRMLPRAPCAHTLQGHSNTVVSVVVHPVFNIACSGSDDATIKVRNILHRFEFCHPILSSFATLIHFIFNLCIVFVISQLTFQYAYIDSSDKIKCIY